MTVDRCKRILQAGIDASLEKMSLPRNISKREITDLSFLELYARMIMESEELSDEICKVETDYEGTPVSVETLNAIRFEAGDVIAFASGIAAKADAELEKYTEETEDKGARENE
jgi:NTP pyrophosphatase (non-canonical NTP hydrolase)